MTFLEFTFSSGWHFIGVAVLICLFFEGIRCVIKAIRGKL